MNFPRTRKTLATLDEYVEGARASRMQRSRHLEDLLHADIHKHFKAEYPGTGVHSRNTTIDDIRNYLEEHDECCPALKATQDIETIRRSEGKTGFFYIGSGKDTKEILYCPFCGTKLPA